MSNSIKKLTILLITKQMTQRRGREAKSMPGGIGVLAEGQGRTRGTDQTGSSRSGILAENQDGEYGVLAEGQGGAG